MMPSLVSRVMFASLPVPMLNGILPPCCLSVQQFCARAVEEQPLSPPPGGFLD
jgi:hypothetical protein